MIRMLMSRLKNNFSLVFACVAVLVLTALLPRVSYAEPWFDVIKQSNIDHLKDDVTLLNLVHGLLLDESQLQELILCAQRAQQDYDHFQKSTYPIQNDYSQKLQVLKDQLLQHQTIPEELEKSVTLLEKEYKSHKQIFLQKMQTHEADIRRILNAAQLLTIEDFQPCTIPPKDLSQPMRAGQAISNLKGLETILDTARRLSQNAYENYIDTFLDNMLSEIELHLGRMTPAEKQQEHQRLKDITDQARLLTDADFLVQRDQLAQQMIEKYHSFTNTIKDLEKIAVRFHGGLSKVSQYLLNPRIIPLLKTHLAGLQQNPRSSNPEKYSTNAGPNPTANRMPLRQKQKLSLEDFFQLISLSQQQIKKIEPIIIEGQKELWAVLTKWRPDGIHMVQEFENIKQSSVSESMKMVKWLELLSLEIPEENQTYLERINNIKSRINARFKQILSQEQFIKFKTSQIDIFDLERKL